MGRIARHFTKVEERIAAGLRARLLSGIGASTWLTDRARETGAVRRWLTSVLRPAGVRASTIATAILLSAYRRGAPQLPEIRAQRAIRPEQEVIAARVAGASRVAADSAIAAYHASIAAGAANASARRLAVEKTLERAVAHGLTGVHDSRGRRWTLPTYLENVVSQAAIRVELTGMIDTLRAGGQSEARVHTEPGNCPRCAPWSGKVISLTGTHERSLSAARAAGLFHPHCHCKLVRADSSALL